MRPDEARIRLRGSILAGAIIDIITLAVRVTPA